MKYQYSRSPAFPHLRGGLPLVAIALQHNRYKVTVSALVDSGAAVSVLPYDVGLELGLKWEKQTVPVDVGGILKDTAAYGVVIQGTLIQLPPVTLVFAWVRHTSDEIRTILGQMNFFQQYRITFEAYDNTFELNPRYQT